MNNPLADLFKWALEMVYGIVGSYGWAIIIITIIMRLVVLPLDIKQRKGMRVQQKLQPQIKAIQTKYANDKTIQQKKMQELYKVAGYHPLSGCLPMIVQMFILFAFFGAQRTIAYGQIEDMFHLAETGKSLAFEGFLWVKNLWQADTFDIGISQINSGLIPTWKQVMAYSKIEGFQLVEDTYNNVMAPYIESFSNVSNGFFILPLLATAMSFLQSKLTMSQTPKQEPSQGTNEAMPQMNTKMLQYMMPVMSLVICTTTSAAYALYWTTTSAIAVVSYILMNRAFKIEDEKAELVAIEEKPSRKMDRKLPKI